VHLHDEAGDQAFRDILVVVAEAEHLRVLDAVQAGVDEQTRGQPPRFFIDNWWRSRIYW